MRRHKQKRSRRPLKPRKFCFFGPHRDSPYHPRRKSLPKKFTVTDIDDCTKMVVCGEATMFLVLLSGEDDALDDAEMGKRLLAAAKDGCASSQHALGCSYREGKGVERDYAEAAKWFRRAAEQGNVAAQRDLGDLYCKGEGVEQDCVEAAKWFHFAAKRGDVHARSALGVMYDKGEGVAQSNRNAYVWHTLAAAGGNKQAEKCRDEAAKLLSAADLSAAHEETLRRGNTARRRLQSPFAEIRSGMPTGDWKWVGSDQDILWKWLQFLRRWRHLVALVVPVETPELRRGGLRIGARRIRARRPGGMLRMLRGGLVRRNDGADGDGAKQIFACPAGRGQQHLRRAVARFGPLRYLAAPPRRPLVG